MNRFAMSGLTALLLTIATSPIAAAQNLTAVDSSFPETAATVGMEVTPFNLVFLAYQGFFEQEGIAMAEGLLRGYQAGRITAEDLVQAAVNMNRLPEDASNDQRYLQAVDYQLRKLIDHGS